jgi:ABC-type multidrug transport system ATPase subunit
VDKTAAWTCPGRDRQPASALPGRAHNGFDPSARQGAWQVGRDLQAAGTTIALTTNYMEEAQELADRVVVIAAGAVVAEGDPAPIGGRRLCRKSVWSTTTSMDDSAPPTTPLRPRDVEGWE